MFNTHTHRVHNFAEDQHNPMSHPSCLWNWREVWKATCPTKKTVPVSHSNGNFQGIVKTTLSGLEGLIKLSESYCTQGNGSLKRNDTDSDQSSKVGHGAVSRKGPVTEFPWFCPCGVMDGVTSSQRWPVTMHRILLSTEGHRSLCVSVYWGSTTYCHPPGVDQWSQTLIGRGANICSFQFFWWSELRWPSQKPA